MIPIDPAAGTGLLALERRLSDSEDPLIPFREALKAGIDHLGEQFDRGRPVTDLVAAHSELVDELLKRACRLKVPAAMPCALVAMGGYGRGELHPGSDIDIMVLLGEKPPQELLAAIEQFIRFLWDIGMEVGHSVRTLVDCAREAEQDVTVITNLLESRLLAGPESLFQRMQESIATDRIWPSDAFFAAKCEEQQERWKKYGDAVYNLEPNIKENPGGLRDIQMIGWVCQRHFGNRTLHQLVYRGFLTEPEYRDLMEGQTLLWKIRYGLHRLSGRREDRLLFDYQCNLAAQFGYTDERHNLAVEQLMQRYYRTVTRLNRLNEMLLQLFQEAIIPKYSPALPVAINKRFQSRNGYLETVHSKLFEHNPVAMLELFLLMQTHPELEGVRASTIRQVRANLHRFDDDLRLDIRARRLFMKILRQPARIIAELRRMNRYGVLAAYIPAFSNIVGRMQYDLFHVYTVDAHTLFVLHNLRSFMIPEHSQEFPLCSAISHTIAKQELLFLAGLFHDIAKGRGGNHSQLGAQDAWSFCQLHGLSDYDSGLVSWLVENHLVLSMTAQRQDISDPATIQTIAELVGDPSRLDYLYLLTAADARATNPARWNSWKDSLLKDLYRSTRHALEHGLDNRQAQDQLVQQKQTEAKRMLQRKGISAERCIGLWRTFSYDFFVNNSPGEISWQTRLALEAEARSLPLAAVRPQTDRGCSAIFLYCADQDGLFTWITALLDQLGLNTLDARIHTTDDHKALNHYLVLEQDGSIVDDAERRQEIVSTLETGIRHPDRIRTRVNRRVPRRHKHFDVKTHISFAANPANNRTLMRLQAGDRPGLLADVGNAFSACGIRLHKAKIATVGAAAEDVFSITNRDNQPIEDLALQTCLRANLSERIEEAKK